jgi:hypothetical protein
VNAGETIVVRVTAARDGSPVTDGPVAAEFWAPGKDPEHEVADYWAPCVYDERNRRWLARVDTTGWAPGRWTVRGVVRGDEPGWAWSSFPLAAGPRRAA